MNKNEVQEFRKYWFQKRIFMSVNIQTFQNQRVWSNFLTKVSDFNKKKLFN